MSKAANIYWDNPEGGRSHAAGQRLNRRRQTRTAPTDQKAAPWWLSFLIVTSVIVMVWVTITLRAYNEVLVEADQNVRLAAQVQNLTDENIALQDEIHALKNDPKVIEHEARRIGIFFEAQKVSVPAN